MKKGRTVAAIDVYNEMKKRAQKPDSYTYLLLLRSVNAEHSVWKAKYADFPFSGLADYAQHPHSLGRALSLYHSMSAQGNKVAPTIRHTNAVLKVCARANDMDSLWDIVSRLPERGPHAADHWTFTTILNNLRLNAIVGGLPGEESNEQVARRRDESVVQGRRLWDLVTRRWRAGDVKIDEELTCAMGRLLLISSRPADWDDVLSLVEQTMGLTRIIPKLGTEERRDLPLPSIRAPHTPDDMKQELSARSDSHGGSHTNDGSQSTEAVDLFSEGVPHSENTRRPAARKHNLHAYARPSNSTLSLVLEACLKMIAKKPANQYWALLTDPTTHAVVPDLDNLHMRLRLLRQSHSSVEVAQTLQDDLAAAKLKPMKKTFAIAMATCARDSRNMSAVNAAGKVLDLALCYLGEPGAKTLRLYLDTVQAVANVAEKTPPASTSGVGSDGLENVRQAVQIQLRALSRLEPGVVPLRSMINFGQDPSDRPAGRSRANWDDEVNRERGDAIELMKRMIGMYDRVVSLCQGREREMGLRPCDKKICVAQKMKLQGFVTRQHKRAMARVVGTQGWRSVKKSDKGEESQRKRVREDADEWIQEPKAVAAVW